MVIHVSALDSGLSGTGLKVCLVDTVFLGKTLLSWCFNHHLLGVH